MLSGFMDSKNSVMRKMLNEDKIDPGSMSFLQPGWWAFHAAAITGLFIVANRITKRP